MRIDRIVAGWAAVGWAGFLVLPWYATGLGPWPGGWTGAEASSPALVQALAAGRLWLLPLAIPLIVAIVAAVRPMPAPDRGRILILAGGAGLAYFTVQGLTIGLAPWSIGGGAITQEGMGWGAAATGIALLFLTTTGFALRGAMRGDVFAVGAVGLVVAFVATFIFYPLSLILGGALTDRAGAFDPAAATARLFSASVWGVDCVFGPRRCGVAWNSLVLAVLTATSTTILGLAFALVATRTGFRFKKGLRLLTVLPVITPPFVIGLAVLLLFGRSGTVTAFVASLLDVPPSRWIYGLPGIWFTQTLAFTPIAFMVLIGVVEGVSPSIEEAAQTLRASRWTTFTTVSLPLMRPGIANAFLIGFIESLADFGNPLVMGGNYQVLSTEIFFSLVGASYDQSRAATLAVVLLFFTLGAFYLQRRWVGKTSYTTVTGKGDSGIHLTLPRSLTRLLYAVTLPWAALTAIMYGMILFGGFVRVWGRDHSLTLRHYTEAFRIDSGVGGLIWSGAAWNSYWTTLEIAAISAPLTAALGLLTAYLLARKRFLGREAFEFGTMLSFAIPGTVIGISYILAFNTPPVEITGTGLILVICFVFRNMPVGVRAGVAAMSQIDKSLEEASETLGARSFTTIRKVILPLLRPAAAAALVFSFVRATTAISAVIFLVSAKYDMATSYIIGRVENGDYGLAIAYSSVLIVTMLAAVGLFQLVVGRRRLGRRTAETKPRPIVLKEQRAA